MLHGRFGDTSGRPYIEGRLVLPRQNMSANLSFLVDTGADRTVLMPVDARQIGVDYGQLTRKTESIGIGGRSLTFVEDATLVFLEPRRFLHVYRVDLRSRHLIRRSWTSRPC